MVSGIEVEEVRRQTCCEGDVRVMRGLRGVSTTTPKYDMHQGLSEPSLGFRWSLVHIIVWWCIFFNSHLLCYIQPCPHIGLTASTMMTLFNSHLLCYKKPCPYISSTALTTCLDNNDNHFQLINWKHQQSLSVHIVLALLRCPEFTYGPVAQWIPLAAKMGVQLYCVFMEQKL